MSGPTRQPYLVEEDILIVELYSRTPLSEIRTSNPEIARLSEFLTEHGRPRTPSAIKFKMENLKSVDKSYLDGRFLESSLKLNRYIKEHERWGVEEMSERTDLLADRFVAVVPELRTDFVPIVKSDEIEVSLLAGKEVFSGNHVLGYVLDGVRVRCKNAKQTYLTLLADLCEQDPERMAYIGSLNEHGQPGQYIRTQTGDIWGYIGHYMYAYFNLDNPTKIRVLRQVVELMDMDPEDVRIIVKPASAFSGKSVPEE